MALSYGKTPPRKALRGKKNTIIGREKTRRLARRRAFVFFGAASSSSIFLLPTCITLISTRAKNVSRASLFSEYREAKKSF
jgi:hypothetical protein